MMHMPLERAQEFASRMVSFASVRPVLSASYLIKGWLSMNSLAALYGPSNVGKTFIALDLAMHVAASAPWRGCRVRTAPVLYIATEGGGGILNRIAAYRAEHPNKSDAAITLLPTELDLHGERDAEALCGALSDPPPGLVVVDTLARSMGDGDENSARDMGALVRNCDFIRKVAGATVLLVHHTGKDEARGMRGSYALKGAVDTEFEVTSERELTCRKQRDMAKPESLHFDLRAVVLGTDEDGDEVTSAVAVASDPPIPPRKPLTGRSEVAMQARYEALRDHGEVKTGGSYPASRKVVHIDRWREACDTHGLTEGTGDSAARTAFKRAKDKLMELNEVRGPTMFGV